MTLTIPQPSSNGFGITITGSCPPRVGRIKTRGAAASAGLKPGDCLVKVNGRCVLRSDARTAVKLIQQSNKNDHVSFDVIRYENEYQPHQQKPIASLSENASRTDILEGFSDLKRRHQKKKTREHCKDETLKRFGNETSVITAETVFPKRRGSATKENLFRFGCGTLPQVESSFGKDLLPPPTVSSVHLSTGSYYKWDSEISHIRFEESSSDSQIESQMYDQSSHLEFNTARIESRLCCLEQSVTSSVIGLQLHQSISSCVIAKQRSQDGVRGKYKIPSSSKPNEIREFLTDDNNNLQVSPSDRSILPSVSVSGNNDILDISQSVFELEKEFVELMTYGIQMFTRPLRSAVLSPNEHRTLFQNIEKVSAYRNNVLDFHCLKEQRCMRP